jgi:hypothetical protein
MFADFDNDGDLNLATEFGLYANGGNANHWLKVRLESLDSAVSRSAKRRLGAHNQNGATLHFGLGSNTGPVTLQIDWPDGTGGNGMTHPGISVDGLVTNTLTP